MKISKDKSQSFEIDGGTTGRLYPSSPKGDQTIASVHVDGVYPKEGWSVNNVVTETIYIASGSIVLYADGQEHTLEAGDLFMVFPETKYRLEGRAECLVFITPSWEKNNNRIVSK